MKAEPHNLIFEIQTLKMRVSATALTVTLGLLLPLLSLGGRAHSGAAKHIGGGVRKRPGGSRSNGRTQGNKAKLLAGAAGLCSAGGQSLPAPDALMRSIEQCKNLDGFLKLLEEHVYSFSFAHVGKMWEAIEHRISHSWGILLQLRNAKRLTLLQEVTRAHVHEMNPEVLASVLHSMAELRSGKSFAIKPSQSLLKEVRNMAGDGPRHKRRAMGHTKTAPIDTSSLFRALARMGMGITPDAPLQAKSISYSPSKPTLKQATECFSMALEQVYKPHTFKP